MEEEHSEMKRKCISLVKEHDALKEENTQLAQKCDSLTQKCDKLTKANLELQGKHDGLEEEKSHLKRKHDELNNQVAALNNKMINNLEEENKAMREQLTGGRHNLMQTTHQTTNNFHLTGYQHQAPYQYLYPHHTVCSSFSPHILGQTHHITPKKILLYLLVNMQWAVRKLKTTLRKWDAKNTIEAHTVHHTMAWECHALISQCTDVC